MELSNQKKLAQHIFRLLKVTEIVIPVGRTNKGNLGLKFSQNSDDFEVYLDAVPLSTKDMLADDNNIELKRMLEKYLFDKTGLANGNVYEFTGDSGEITVFSTISEPKKRGRPAGSKNKK